MPQLPAPDSSADGNSPPLSLLVSPSLTFGRAATVPAYEMKFLLPAAIAMEVQRWADTRMQLDPFAAKSSERAYQTTTLYLDTPALDLFHGTQRFRGRKFRVRRYGSEDRVYLERKTKRGDRVRKRRSSIPDEELHRLATGQFQDPHPDEWAGTWFQRRIHLRELRPVCCVTYERVAYLAMSDHGPIRVTLDRQIRGVLAEGWNFAPVNGQGLPILTSDVICEFKFRDTMPAMFRQLLAELQLQPASVSKYKSLMRQFAASGAVETQSLIQEAGI